MIYKIILHTPKEIPLDFGIFSRLIGFLVFLVFIAVPLYMKIITGTLCHLYRNTRMVYYQEIHTFVCILLICHAKPFYHLSKC